MYEMYQNMDMQDLIDLAEDDGDADAMFVLAKGILSGSPVVEERNPQLVDLGLKYLKKSIKGGNADAMNEMGALYYSGTLVKQDYKKAASLYRQAADLGHAFAMCNLGYCYYYGRGMDVDMQNAFIWYSKAALFDNHQALYKLGDMYMNGFFVPKDEGTAMNLYFRAYKLSEKEVDGEYGQEVYSGACLRVARCAYEGTGTDRNLEEAGRIIDEAVYYFRKRWQRHDELCAEGFASAKELQKKIREELEEQDRLEEGMNG